MITGIPARLDRLPWSRFHLMVVVALGVTWILDGLEVTLMGAVSGVLQLPQTLHLSGQEIGLAGSSYVAGAVAGALAFGYGTDRWGRRVIFFVTLAVYLGGVLLTALSWNGPSLSVFRAITGLGIGGEYAAINSAIDELIPARLRGRVDLIVNGSFWLGAALGAAATIALLDPRILPVDVGWRMGFAIGASLGLFILALRRHVPESPRWLVTHGRAAEAETVVDRIESRAAGGATQPPPPPPAQTAVHPRKTFGFGLILKHVAGRYRRRGVLCLVLMLAQAFLYNSVFFTFGLVLTRFYGTPGRETGLYLFPLALGNFLGPLLIGRFFDTIGRRRMSVGPALYRQIFPGRLLGAALGLSALTVAARLAVGHQPVRRGGAPSVANIPWCISNCACRSPARRWPRHLPSACWGSGNDSRRSVPA